MTQIEIYARDIYGDKAKGEDWEEGRTIYFMDDRDRVPNNNLLEGMSIDEVVGELSIRNNCPRLVNSTRKIEAYFDAPNKLTTVTRPLHDSEFTKIAKKVATLYHVVRDTSFRDHH